MERSCVFDRENEDTGGGIGRHELSNDESTPRALAVPDASEKKLCSSASGLSPEKYLQN